MNIGGIAILLRHFLNSHINLIILTSAVEKLEDKKIDYF
jgi:hypothetical protein